MKEFRPFRLDIANECLWRRREQGEDERILLTPKAFEVLRCLVERAGRLVSHEEFLDLVWQGTVVQPQAVKKLILNLRKVLGDCPENPVFIETLHRRGYRFIAPVTDESKRGPLLSIDESVPKIVGRESPLKELRKQLDKALKGQRQIVFITGELGIGKTALADEFRRLAAGEIAELLVARGQCLEGYGGKEAYYPVLEALGQLCEGSNGDSIVRILAARAPALLEQLPSLSKPEQLEPPRRGPLGATRDRMLREICVALDAIAAERPLLLVLEDLQWADYPTVDLISALARRRTPAKLFVIATKRPLDAAEPQHPLRALKDDLIAHRLCREIVLQSLGAVEAAELLSAESRNAPLPEGLARVISGNAEGNPLFLLALTEHLTERRLIGLEQGVWRLKVPLGEIAREVPRKLRRMLEAEIDSLTRQEQEALEAASVSGIAFWAPVAAAAAGLDLESVEEICQRLSRRRQILRPAGYQRLSDGRFYSRYEFVHAFYREACYQRWAPGARAAIHLRIGQQLEGLFPNHLDEVAAELAYHFEAGADWTSAVKYICMEAQNAERRHTQPDASELLQHALDLSEHLPTSERVTAQLWILDRLAQILTASNDPRAGKFSRRYEALKGGHGLVDVPDVTKIDTPLVSGSISTKQSRGRHSRRQIRRWPLEKGSR
ncbi:MAG: AAA family ATPase [Deltaproteobacteria bacterium]|nr:AAA family ATPase [Deltaproteobacteria bacterium]